MSRQEERPLLPARTRRQHSPSRRYLSRQPATQNPTYHPTHHLEPHLPTPTRVTPAPPQMSIAACHSHSLLGLP